ncbi:MAG: type II toxin-antitoxin system VapC family toxin [Patescibacteria group bacterium]
MTYLLDTDVVISHLNNKALLSLSFTTPPNMSIISYAETLYGIQKSTYHERKNQFRELIENMSIAILPIDECIITRYVSIKLALEKKGEKLQDFDLLIAATAIEHHLTLVTGNKKYFSRIKGLKIL